MYPDMLNWLHVSALLRPVVAEVDLIYCGFHLSCLTQTMRYTTRIKFEYTRKSPIDFCSKSQTEDAVKCSQQVLTIGGIPPKCFKIYVPDIWKIEHNIACKVEIDKLVSLLAEGLMKLQ